jgi:hypothetical protein
LCRQEWLFALAVEHYAHRTSPATPSRRYLPAHPGVLGTQVLCINPRRHVAGKPNHGAAVRSRSQSRCQKEQESKSALPGTLPDCGDRVECHVPSIVSGTRPGGRWASSGMAETVGGAPSGLHAKIYSFGVILHSWDCTAPRNQDRLDAVAAGIAAQSPVPAAAVGGHAAGSRPNGD